MIVLVYSIYTVAFLSLVFWTRAYTWTEQDALPAPAKKPGFGKKISLTQAARAMFYFGGPRVLAGTCIVSLIARLCMLEISWADLWVTASILAFWPFQEWLIHAWLEHLKPLHIGKREVELVITKTHRAHHRNPWDPRYGLTTTYFVIAFVGGVPMLWSLAYTFGLVPLHAALSGNLITFLLILNYEWIHFLIHTAYVPKSWFYRRLWRNHRLHHFQNENYWFGLTMLSGDRLLGTLPSGNRAVHSQTVMNLGVDTPHDSIAEMTVPTATENKGVRNQ